MASILFADFLDSTQFKFFVGPEAKEYTIHSALVACQSEPLDAMVNGKFKEGEGQCVIWKEVEVDTFIRFSQYAYTGNYEGAESRKIFDVTPVLKSSYDSDDWDVSYHSTQKSKKEQMWEKFCQLYPRPQPSFKSNMVNEDYTEVLLSHARMYVFADCYGIKDLQKIALRKLKEELSRYKLYDQGPREIAQLIKYSFDNTADHTEQRDPLRNLVSTYSAYRIEELLEKDDFDNLLRTISDFPVALITKLRERLD